MKAKDKILNQLIRENDFKSYLEIGYAQGSNFHSIQCESKLAIDIKTPQSLEVLEMSSDEFFEKNDLKFDLIFIDGDHDCNQVEKDIKNSWYSLNKGGIIALHDVRPFTKEMQMVPRTQDQWTGDVWRAFTGFQKAYPKVRTQMIDEKYGLGLIYKKGSKVELGFVDNETTYEDFRKSIEDGE